MYQQKQPAFRRRSRPFSVVSSSWILLVFFLTMTVLLSLSPTTTKPNLLSLLPTVKALGGNNCFGIFRKRRAELKKLQDRRARRFSKKYGEDEADVLPSSSSSSPAPLATWFAGSAAAVAALAAVTALSTMLVMNNDDDDHVTMGSTFTKATA